MFNYCNIILSKVPPIQVKHSPTRFINLSNITVTVGAQLKGTSECVKI